MNRTFVLLLLIAGLAAVICFQRSTGEVMAASTDGPQFTAEGKLILPVGYRKWVFVGAPLTPNGLNNGKAGFPEYHNVLRRRTDGDSSTSDTTRYRMSQPAKKVLLLSVPDAIRQEPQKQT